MWATSMASVSKTAPSLPSFPSYRLGPLSTGPRFLPSSTSILRETLNKPVFLRRCVFSMPVEALGFGFFSSQPASAARS
jgi:hypothetical protein